MLYALDEVSPRVGGECFVAPDAAVIGNVLLHDESSVWFGAVIRGDNELIEIGRGANVQDGSVLHTDPGAPLKLGEYVTVGHQVMLHGCHIGANALIGIGATVLNHARIGANSLVGAHALITEGKEFPDGVLILGSPAKVVRELTDEEIGALKQSARHYIERAALYRRRLRPLSDVT